MKHPTLLLVLFVLAAFSVGYLTGYRGRISEEPDYIPIHSTLAWR